MKKLIKDTLKVIFGLWVLLTLTASVLVASEVLGVPWWFTTALILVVGAVYDFVDDGEE